MRRWAAATRRAGSTSPASWPRRSKGCGEEPGPRDATDTRRKERRAMTKHMTGTRKEWLAARLELLEAEKELKPRSDELARRGQELPRGRIGKGDRVQTDAGGA